MKINLTQDRLKEILHYNKNTGVFIRIARTRNHINVGSIAGCNCRGYQKIKADGRIYLAHRLAWLYVYGVWPAKHIDHIDGDPSNNRISNLRDVSRSENGQNQKKAQSGSKTGLLGASPFKKKFVANIRINGKLKHLGTFESALLAHEAYLKAKRCYHPAGTL